MALTLVKKVSENPNYLLDVIGIENLHRKNNKPV
jgi:hypothetical protein